ncbi:MAG: zinc-ribbon domain-containing protein [Lachnospiraceae bacterium]
MTSLPENMIPPSDEYAPHRMHRCPSCGFETEEDYQYCPKCGQRLS